MTETGRKNNYANYNFALAFFYVKKGKKERMRRKMNTKFAINYLDLIFEGRKNEFYDERLQSLDAHF